MTKKVIVTEIKISALITIVITINRMKTIRTIFKKKMVQT